jgi:hypothetical protein
MAITAACVKIVTRANATLSDAFQYGVAGDTSWSFTGQHFHMDIKASNADSLALLSLTDANGRIVVDDAINRVLHLNVDDVTLDAALPVGEYVYDLIMYDTSTPAIRVALQQGVLKIVQGVTGN